MKVISSTVRFELKRWGPSADLIVKALRTSASLSISCEPNLGIEAVKDILATLVGGRRSLFFKLLKTLERVGSRFLPK